MTCPDVCRQNLKTIEKDVDGHGKTLYGDDGRGGLSAGYEALKNCMTKFITRKGGIATAIAIMTSVIILSVAGLAAWSGEKDKRSNNTTNIKVIQKQLETIEETVSTIKTNQEIILREQVKPHELMEMITKAVKEGNESQ